MSIGLTARDSPRLEIDRPNEKPDSHLNDYRVYVYWSERRDSNSRPSAPKAETYVLCDNNLPIFLLTKFPKTT